MFNEAAIIKNKWRNCFLELINEFSSDLEVNLSFI